MKIHSSHNINFEKSDDVFKVNTTKIFYKCQEKTKWNGNKLTTGSKKLGFRSTCTIFTDVWNNPFDEIGQKQFLVFLFHLVRKTKWFKMINVSVLSKNVNFRLKILLLLYFHTSERKSTKRPGDYSGKQKREMYELP